MRNFWQIEFPVGAPDRGAPYGERLDPGTASIASLIMGGLGAVSSVSSLLGMGKKESAPAPAPPVVSPVTPMPTSPTKASITKKQQTLLGQLDQNRMSRQDTILTDKLGA